MATNPAAAHKDAFGAANATQERYDETTGVNVRAPSFLIQEPVKIMPPETIETSIANIRSMSAPAIRRWSGDAAQ